MTSDNSKPSRERRNREATARNSAWAALPSIEKMKSLDSRLGVSIGAKKQRKTLAHDILLDAGAI